jgi:uncharacterized protein
MFKKIPILFTLIFAGLVFQSPVFSETNFPVLTDRVVDEAGLLDQGGFQKLRRMLQQQEDKTGIQIVVAILKNLRGNEISDYSVNLARQWKIGQKDKNNGLLLLIAVEEKKMRIEVGYGLEGKMTDARSKYIIESIIKPDFKAGNFQQGILRGVAAITLILNDENTSEIDEAAALAAKKENTHHANHISSMLFNIIFWLIIILIPLMRIFFGRNNYTRRGGFYGGGMSGGGFSSGGGGFSGGGGSFGGGGASGSW